MATRVTDDFRRASRNWVNTLLFLLTFLDVRFVPMLFGRWRWKTASSRGALNLRHHRCIDDNARDPYSAKRGLWLSHIGWMLRDYPSGKRDHSNIADVLQDPIAVFQDRHYVALALLMNIGVPLAVGGLAGDLWGVFLLGGLMRLAVSHHTSFFINSLAHVWGSQPYTNANTSF